MFNVSLFPITARENSHSITFENCSANLTTENLIRYFKPPVYNLISLNLLNILVFFEDKNFFSAYKHLEVLKNNFGFKN